MEDPGKCTWTSAYIKTLLDHAHVERTATKISMIDGNNSKN